MQEIDKIKKHNKILRAVLIVCLVIIVVLVGIMLLPNKETQNIEYSETVSKMISIETPYCALEYPAESAELLKCVDSNEDDIYSKIFYGCIDGREIELFEIAFGTRENATLIGYIMHNGVKHPVFVRSIEIDNTLDQNSQNTIYMMQEGINDVIQSITSNENYLEK